jgi:hypothetical protein
MLNGTSFFRTVKKGKLQVFKSSLYNMNKAIVAKDLKERPLEEIVPEQYHEFLPLFKRCWQLGYHHIDLESIMRFN